ncbi:aconitase/3-isopropylmalate dehydratase large subunit family protein [Methanoregula sp.]|uniref:aconitase/3-isopropylmalate dehydratase large subunit family protein n=1 Tax=Methanoregula sp. TaxID=2052170 RepID=UPI00236A2E23|nr:aconitase/3-isopropylmalate dehydratase large subunit family protein [Methanoregula sp.]MDD1686669.1 3-isopropylmalate dehydratase large subunit [Methanoregula sp.]
MSTLSERILNAPAGEYVDRKVDRAYACDGTGLLALEAWKNMGASRLADATEFSIIFDHIAPANNTTTATLQHELREFAKSSFMNFSDIGCGICHQLMSEGVVLPGEIVIGADSHSVTLGAFGAFASGVGATDMAAIWLTGETWFRVPATIAVHLEGRFTGAAEAKDLALAYVGELGTDGATYQSLEFVGDGTKDLSIDERLVLSNLSVEAGAKAGLFYADDVTVRYLKERGHAVKPQVPETCTYLRDLEFDLSDIVPLIAVPHRVDTVKPVDELAGLPLDQVFVGTCTNGRYSDLARLARIIKGNKVAVRTIVVPASAAVLTQAIRTGVLADIVEAGCTIGTPGCGPCLGAHMGVLGEEEVCLSTANRNFKNRMGVGGEIYLSSVATAAASALEGEITVPEVA